MLNKAQKEAVDHIEGPLMVIAGPGTGKTELLSMRVANILQKTDTLPENILCLTFTDSGVSAMRDRLIEIIDKDAYRVAIHTFHSFGSEIIRSNGEFFYSGAEFRPSDALTSREVLEKIFIDLPHTSVLASKNEDEYTYLPDSLKVISELKKSGLTSDELLSILDDNELAIQKANQLLAPIFASKMNIRMIEPLKKALKPINESCVKPKFLDLPCIGELLVESLERAIEDAKETNKTNSLTAWKNTWMAKTKQDKFELKSSARQTRLREVAYIYDRYLKSMQENKLYDYDDMILRALHASEIFPELRYNLQEKYQYVMVDEFQDTNLAQMRLVHSLTDSISSADQPNIMVVGDDDQAIYSFQGADVSNILSFAEHYPKTKLITLTENYRSGSSILEASRYGIIQGQDRLENKLETIDKRLSSQPDRAAGEVIVWKSPSIDQEKHWLVDSIQARLEAGENPSSITVLTRNHKDINELLPYFAKNNIDVCYERKENILDQPPIDMLYRISIATLFLSRGRHDDFNGMLPEIISHPAWKIDPETILKLSLRAYDDENGFWINAMEHFEATKPIRQFFINLSAQLSSLSLEQILDKMMGSTLGEECTSPLKDYFFSDEQREQNPEIFVNYLIGLRTLRRKMREYLPNDTPSLASFVDFIESHKKAHLGISLINENAGIEGGVNLMTAHKAKGLEFDTVYIFDATDSTWGHSARKSSRKISYPENLPLEPAGDSDDERLRLFYVAMTRAKRSLNISFSDLDEKNKKTERLEYLLGINAVEKIIEEPKDYIEIEDQALISWHQQLAVKEQSLKDILAPTLKNYKLAATHLNTFIDVSRGGPQTFLINNLLRFPSGMSPSASYGSSAHDIINLAHQNIIAGNPPQAIEDLLSLFERNLSGRHLAKTDFDYFLKKGFDSLGKFFENRYSSFSKTQKAELDFYDQGAVVAGAILTGKIDLVDFIDQNKVVITDYKTGKAAYSWKGSDASEQIKLYKYKQQLLFYKLMMNTSRDYSKYDIEQGKLCFVEPTKEGELKDLTLEFQESELEHLERLIGAVWKRIISLNLPDTSKYSQTLNGIRQFEQDLIDDLI